MAKVNVHEAKTNFPKRVERALQDEEIIARSGKLVTFEGPAALRVSEMTALKWEHGERTGFVAPCRSRQAVYERLAAACRQARVRYKGVHARKHASGTWLHDETGDLAPVADDLRHSSLDTARGYAKANNVQLKRALGEV